MRALLPALACAALLGCKDPLAIRTDRSDYSPAMSSAPGLGMSAVPVAPAGSGVRYHWHASYGRFLRWEAPSYKVDDLGPDVRVAGGKVYWSYDAAGMESARPAVRIELTAEDGSGRELARAGLSLGWNGGRAVISR